MSELATSVTLKEKKDILARFSAHYSGAQVSYLRGGNLDILESNRKGATFVETYQQKKFYDAFGSAGCFNVGRSNDEVIAALEDVSNQYGDMGNHRLLSPSKISYAQKLTSLTPGDLNRVIFSTTGGEAVESAIKLAKASTGRDEVIAMKLGYHGLTGLALSAGGKDHYKELFLPLAPGFKLAEFNDLASVKRLASDKTAAILLEVVQGEGGIHVGSLDYYQGLRELCDELGIVLIFDEVQTGFARTGTLFFTEQTGVIPDIMILAKSLSGGLFPNAAIVYRDIALFNNYLEQYPEFHLSTGGGSDLGCYVAESALDYLVENNIPENAQKRGLQIKQGLTDLAKRQPHMIKEVRGVGMMLAMEYHYEFMGATMAQILSTKGVFAIYSTNAPQTMRFMLAPTITEEEVNEFLSRVEAALDELKVASRVLIPFSKIPLLGNILNNESLMVKFANMIRRD